jgi:hypothetical protein
VAAGNAQSNDVQSLLVSGLAYAAVELPDGLLLPPINIKAKKLVAQGFNHPVLTCLLCPVKYLSDFNADPKG